MRLFRAPARVSLVFPCPGAELPSLLSVERFPEDVQIRRGDGGFAELHHVPTGCRSFDPHA